MARIAQVSILRIIEALSLNPEASNVRGMMVGGWSGGRPLKDADKEDPGLKVNV